MTGRSHCWDRDRAPLARPESAAIQTIAPGARAARGPRGLRLFALAAVILTLGCAARPASAWQPEEAEAVAWWCEDLAHGHDREPGELEFIAGSARASAVACWAAGVAARAGWEPPRRLAARRARWPALASALASGSVLPAGDSGLLMPFPGVAPAQRAAVAALVDAENDDRRFLDAVVRAAGHPDPEVERVHREAVRLARRTLELPPVGAAAPAAR